MTITDTMLDGLRQQVVDMISKARYMINGTWHMSNIIEKTVQLNGAIHATFYVQRADGSDSPATRFQLLNESGQVLAERIETVAFTQYVDALVYRFKFGISVAETATP